MSLGCIQALKCPLVKSVGGISERKLSQNICTKVYLLKKDPGALAGRESRVLFPGYFFVDADDGSEMGKVLRMVLARFTMPMCAGADFLFIRRNRHF